jgi:Ca2+-binding RTX toxin-like protein
LELTQYIMKTTIRNHRSSVALVLGTLATLVLAGCSGEAPVLGAEDGDEIAEPGEQASNDGVKDNGEEVVQFEDALGQEITTVFSSDTNKKLTIDLDAGVVGDATSMTLSVANNALTVNGFVVSHKLLVASPAATPLKPSDVKLIEIKTKAAGDKIVIDNLGGAIGSGTLTYAGSAATAGVVIDVAGNAAEISIRGTTAADNWKAAQSTDGVFFETTGDKKADIWVKGAGASTSTYTVALADGADTFNAMAFGPLAAPVTGLTAALDAVAGLTGTTNGGLKPLTVAATVYGGAGADTISGGVGNDKLYGGAGADVFKAATAPELTTAAVSDDGDDVVMGGADLDKVDYSGRTAAVRVKLDGVLTDADPMNWTYTKAGHFTLDMMTNLPTDPAMDMAAEDDKLSNDLEDIVGGEGNDFLTGNTLPNKIVGGKGNDFISGGLVGNNSCVTPAAMSSDPPKNVDNLDGGEGNDTFDMDTAGPMGVTVETSDCGTTVTGGAGTDTVDYSKRTEDVQIALDGKASSGQVADASATPMSGLLLTVSVIDNGTAATLKTDIENVLGSKTDRSRIIGSASDNVITGGDLADVVDGQAGNDTIKGGLLGDTLVGQLGNDTIDGEAGTDTLSGGDGDDILSGGDDNDTVNGGAGNDKLKGGLGVDTINGDAGDDEINEGEETDNTDPMNPVQVIHGAGDDIINGGAGYNKLTYAGRVAGITAVMCNDATDLVAESTACPVLMSKDTILNISWLVGGEDVDTLTGTSGVDLIEGGAGGDTIHGGASNDRLYGDAGGDTINGDAGDDSVEGGDGDDVINGDTGMTNSGEDICVDDAADMTPAVNCEL